LILQLNALSGDPAAIHAAFLSPGSGGGFA
jgi:hypothetical protein